MLARHPPPTQMCSDHTGTDHPGLCPVEHPPAPQIEALNLPSCSAAAIVMKVPKPKEGEKQRDLWVPPERLWFDKNQRVQVRHPVLSRAGQPAVVGTLACDKTCKTRQLGLLTQAVEEAVPESGRDAST